MTQVTLVHSPPHGEVPFRSIGLAYLQAALLARGHEAGTIDLSLEEDRSGDDFYGEYIGHLSERVGAMGDGPDPRILMEVVRPDLFADLLPVSRTILRKVERHLPRLLATEGPLLFTVNTLTVYFAAAMASRLRAAGRRTAAGGPACTFPPLRNLLLRCGAFDTVVQGEGDLVVAPLVDALCSLPTPSVPGASWLEDDVVRSLPPGAPGDLDALPMPSFLGTDVRDFVPVLSSRGCPHRCTYCSEPSHWGCHRTRSPESVVAEMVERAGEYGCGDFHFHDDLINGDLAWLDRFTSLLIEAERGFRWESFCAPEGLSAARLGQMRRSGCVLLKLGVQSFSPRVLGLMGRPRNVSFARAAILDAARSGISMHFDMLTCFPGETDEDHRLNVETIEGIFSERPDVYFSPNPFYLSLGSATMLEPDRYGMRLIDFDPDTLPAPAAEVVRASGRFPVSFASPIPREVVRQRLGELGGLLSRYGRDYLYLGKEKRDDGPARPRS